MWPRRDSFSLAGTASVAVTHLGNLGVTFGHTSLSGAQTPDLSITGGSLVGLDMTIDSNITVGGVSFTTTGLEFMYTAKTSTFSLAGAAVAQVANVGNLGVTFGEGTTPGLVVSGGALTNLNMTVDSNINVGGVTFTASGLNFQYDATGADASRCRGRRGSRSAT